MASKERSICYFGRRKEQKMTAHHFTMHLAILLTGTVLLSPEIVWAELQITAFPEMFERCGTIIVVRCVDDPPAKRGEKSLPVEIIEIVKGDLKPGKYAITLPKYERFPHRGKKGDEFIAFLDEDKVMQFMAYPARGAKAGQGLLCIDGAYARSAHWVRPGLATLEQIKTFQSKKTLDYRFRGDLFFPEPGKAAWKASSLSVVGSYDAVKDKGQAAGLPKLNQFAKPPQILLTNEHARPALELIWPGKRSLKLYGNVIDIDAKSGEFIVRFVVAEPLVLSQKSLEEYLADQRLGPAVYQFKLACTAAKGEAIPKFLTLKMGSSGDLLVGYPEGALRAFQKSYCYEHGSMNAGVVLAEEIPKSVYDDSIQRDGFLRLTMKLAAGKFLTVNFRIGEPASDETDAYWTLDNRLAYGFYRAKQIEGNIKLHEPTGARIQATFSATLERVGLSQLP
jgi:hypothetical protein